MSRRCLVVSAVNFTEGGPLTVLREFVAGACATLAPEWEIVIFVHDRQLLHAPRARLVEVPYAKRGWLRRMWVEWVEFRGHARRLAPDLWVSLHDITPNVGPVPQAVYCHNPAPFFSLRPRDAWFQPTQLFFYLAYGLLYRINIKRNRVIVVQQQWLRERFRKWVTARTRIIVAHPAVAIDTSAGRRGEKRRRDGNGRTTFLYPAFPRPFKNLELIASAVERLERDPRWRGEVIFTIDGTENRYARWLKHKFGGLRTLRFIGRQSPQQMQRHYADVDCLLFPSRMETWGLPISEAKAHDLPMLVADLPYAKETIGSYGSVDFIDIDDHEALARKLLSFQEGSLEFRATLAFPPDQPFVSGWVELIEALAKVVA